MVYLDLYIRGTIHGIFGFICSGNTFACFQVVVFTLIAPKFAMYPQWHGGHLTVMKVFILHCPISAEFIISPRNHQNWSCLVLTTSVQQQKLLGT